MSLLRIKQLTSPLNITGSLFGTASYANIAGPTFLISTGSIRAQVNIDTGSIFLINSGSTNYVNITSTGDTTLTSNLLIIKNLTTQKSVLSISQSIVQFATQSIDPQDPTEAGTIWFTSSSLYIGLE
jgi:hypothetical protein